MTVITADGARAGGGGLLSSLKHTLWRASALELLLWRMRCECVRPCALHCTPNGTHLPGWQVPGCWYCQ